VLAVFSDQFLNSMDNWLFGVLPYPALIVFFLFTIRRYRQDAFTYSSLSSQFLENKEHFWGMVPFHYGLLLVLLGHVIGFFAPTLVLDWNASSGRLYLLELIAFTCGLLAMMGLVIAIVRRVSSSKIREVSTVADYVLYVMLLFQIGSGLYIATKYFWGSSWFAAAGAPYLWSLVRLSPEITYVSAMPFAVKAHIVSAWLLIAFFPFTRLVHVLVVPNPYLWRRVQVVRWNWSRKGKASARLDQSPGSYSG